MEVTTPCLLWASHTQPASNNVYVGRQVSALGLCRERNNAYTKHGAPQHIMHTRGDGKFVIDRVAQLIMPTLEPNMMSAELSE